MSFQCDLCAHGRLRDNHQPESRYCGRDGRSIKQEEDAADCASLHAYQPRTQEWKPATIYRHDEEIPDWRFDDATG